MTNKDLLKKDVIKEIWPHVQLRICAFHVEKIFDRSVLKYCEGMDKLEKENLKDLLKKLIYSESKEHYTKLYSDLCDAAPPAFLKYYKNNWDNIIQEWCQFTAPPGSLGNNTNNQTECFNMHIKAVAKKNNLVYRMAKSFFIFNESHQQVDGKAAAMLKKKNWNVAESDPLWKYDNLLTNGALKYVEAEIKKSEFINLEEIESGTFIVKAKNVTFTPTLEFCNC